MKLLINTATTYKGGGVQVAKSFIEECRKFDSHEYHVILGQTIAGLIDESEFPSNFSFYRIGYRPATRVLHFRSKDRFFRELEERIRPDIVFTTSGPAYWRPKAPHLAGYNLPHYIYKDSPYFEKISGAARMKWWLKEKVIRYFFRKDADAYVVQTDDVNDRLIEFLGSHKVYTVSNTHSEAYIKPKHVPKKLPPKKAGEFRLLSFSAWYAHKNLDIIPAVIDRLTAEKRKSVRFVLTLPGDIYNSFFPEMYRDSILNVGPVIPDEGPSLYMECDALFLPTLLECFSASYAEAMVMEKPIITSDLGFARSICGEAALYVNPADPEHIADEIVKLTDNPDLVQELIQSGRKQLDTFPDGKRRAEAYLNICKQLVNSR